MGNARMIIILVVAAIAAIGLALIVHGVAGHRPPPAVVVAQAPTKPMTQVLVAHRDLAVGTALAAGDLAWQPWPADAVNPAFITDGHAAELAPSGAAAIVEHSAAAAAQAVVAGNGQMESLYGSIVREAILANEPIAQSKLVRGGAGGYMAVVLHPGMRAVAVPISTATSAGGFILPGDHVDVLQSRPSDAPAGHGQSFNTQTLLRNVKVLAIDQASQPPKGVQSVVGAVATLEIAASDVEMMARAKAQGEMVLVLRAYSDAGGPSSRGVVETQSNGAVHIFRAGQASEVTVTP